MFIYIYSHGCPPPDLTNQTSPNYNSMYDCRMYDNRWLPVNVSAQMAPLNWYVFFFVFILGVVVGGWLVTDEADENHIHVWQFKMIMVYHYSCSRRAIIWVDRSFGVWFLQVCADIFFITHLDLIFHLFLHLFFFK